MDSHRDGHKPNTGQGKDGGEMSHTGDMGHQLEIKSSNPSVSDTGSPISLLPSPNPKLQAEEGRVHFSIGYRPLVTVGRPELWKASQRMRTAMETGGMVGEVMPVFHD